MNNKKISDVISMDEVRTWKKGDTITIKGGTGSGKSHFIKTILYAFAKANDKRILFLIHRTNCVNQFQKEIEKAKKTDVIEIRTYQSIEAAILHNKECSLYEYDYIVCDEFHYFISDSSYNPTTDISLNTILSYSRATKIFMSATGDFMKQYIKTKKKIETKDYEVPINYNHIDDLTFFYKDNTLYEFAEECIEKNQKAIFFIQSAKKAYDLYEKFKGNCLFNCSTSNSEFYKYVNKDKINSLLDTERFEENILITTTCLDAGVNINDLDLQHIVCDVEDIDVLKQCIGRKRIQNDEDKVNIYIKAISNNQLGGREVQLRNKIKKADFLKEHTVKEYIMEYPRSNDYTNIVYDEIVADDNSCSKKVNELMYYKVRYDLLNIGIMLGKEKTIKFGYCKYLAKEFGFERYRTIEEESKILTLEEYLESVADKFLNENERAELIERVGLKDAKYRLQKSISLINVYLIKNTKYTVTSKVVKETINGKRKNITYWIVTKIK